MPGKGGWIKPRGGRKTQSKAIGQQVTQNWKCSQDSMEVSITIPKVNMVK